MILAFFLGWIALDTGQDSQKQQVFLHLTTVRETARVAIEEHFRFIMGQCRTQARNRMVVDAMRQFREAFGQLRDSPATMQSQKAREKLTAHYLGPFAREYTRRNLGSDGKAEAERLLAALDDTAVILQERFVLPDAPSQAKETASSSPDHPVDATTYGQLHAVYHPLFQEFRQTFGYGNLFLVDADSGSVVYAAMHTIDLATSLRRGPFADSHLARLARKALTTEGTEAVVLEDFAPHVPVYGEPVGFVASPIVDNKQKIGVLILQMTQERINTIMTHAGQWQTAGLGRTGESYLVGADFKMRSNSRPFLENRDAFLASLQKGGLSRTAAASLASQGRTSGLLAIRNGATEAALAGHQGVGAFAGYRGYPVWAAHAPVTISGLHWGVISEMEVAEALQPMVALRTSMIFYAIWLIVLLLGITAGITWFKGRFGSKAPKTQPQTLAAPSRQQPQHTAYGFLARSGSDPAPQHLTTLVLETSLQAHTLLASLFMLSNMRKEFTHEVETNIGLVKNVVDDNAQMQQHMANIQKSVKETESRVSAIGIAAEELSNSITAIATSAATASSHITTVASATEEITANISGVNQNLQQVDRSVHSVAKSIQVVTNSLEGVRERCRMARDISERANESARHSREVMHQLETATREISKVVDVINDIAEQTNMLALNAAIEAAGAGDAGKGFAVVANEVKELARQTAKATHMIAGHIEEIQNVMGGVSDANDQITDGIDKVNLANREIALAVDDQTANVNGIANAMQTVSEAAADVTRAVMELETATQDVSRSTMEAATGTSQIASAASQAVVASDDLVGQNRVIHDNAATIAATTREGDAAIQTSATHMRQISVSMELLNGLANLLNILINTFHIPVEKLQKAAANQQKELSEPFDVQKIKQAHLAWLSRLLRAILDGRETISPETAGNAHLCDLGKWYDSEGQQRFGHLEVFRTLGKVHEKVHLTGKETVLAAAAGKRTAALEAMARFDTIRQELFELLDQLYLETATTGNPPSQPKNNSQGP
ncbi:MAG: methyl-accepting chemotaxis protein [Magnetococcus sp. DMHC-1]